MSNQMKGAVFILPDDVCLSQGIQLLNLRNPHTQQLSYFLLDKGNKKLYEIQGFDEIHRSWFIESNIYADGCIKLSSPYSPLFLILPYLIKAVKNVPLEQLLDDEEYPQMKILTDYVSDLSCVADRKGPPDLNVWCFNEDSTLQWLSKKIDALSLHLEKTRENAILHTVDKDSLRRAAFDILSECLCESLTKKLFLHLKLPEEKKHATKLGSSDHENKKMKLESDTLPKANKKALPKVSAKEKALAKSAKGSKSITSFFSKK